MFWGSPERLGSEPDGRPRPSLLNETRLLGEDRPPPGLGLFGTRCLDRPGTSGVGRRSPSQARARPRAGQHPRHLCSLLAEMSRLLHPSDKAALSDLDLTGFPPWATPLQNKHSVQASASLQNLRRAQLWVWREHVLDHTSPGGGLSASKKHPDNANDGPGLPSSLVAQLFWR